jgi:hypothetical protein
VQPDVPQPVFLNVEYLFSSFYNFIKGFLAWLFSMRSIAFLEILATLLVIAGIAVILYCLVRLYEIKNDAAKKEAAKQAPSISTVATGVPAGLPGATGTGATHNPVWESVRTKILSDNPSEWRLAIIEADIYLDKLLDDTGYHGATVSDKLKQVNELTLSSLQLAWEAHKVRNRIAHDGAAYALSQPESRRVLSYYEIVFRDLGAIA